MSIIADKMRQMQGMISPCFELNVISDRIPISAVNFVFEYISVCMIGLPAGSMTVEIPPFAH